VLGIFPCLDSDEKAKARKRDLNIPHHIAAELGRSAIESAEKGYYVCEGDKKVDWIRYVQAAHAAKVSIPPVSTIPEHEFIPFPETHVQVTNETTLGANLLILARLQKCRCRADTLPKSHADAQSSEFIKDLEAYL